MYTMDDNSQDRNRTIGCWKKSLVHTGNAFGTGLLLPCEDRRGKLELMSMTDRTFVRGNLPR